MDLDGREFVSERVGEWVSKSGIGVLGGVGCLVFVQWRVDFVVGMPPSGIERFEDLFCNRAT